MILYKRNAENSIASGADNSRDNSRLMARMVTSYSIFLLIILGLSVYLYFSAANNMRSQFREQNRSMLRSSMLLLDKDLDIMEIFSRQLLQDNTFMRLASADGPQTVDFYLDGFSTKNDLAANMYPETLLPIYEYYIHFENSHYLLSPSHFVERSLFYSGTRRYPPELFDSWVKMLEDPIYHNTFLSLNNYTNSPDLRHYLYIMNLNSLVKRHINATICFIIDAEKLAELFKGIEFYDTGYLLAADSQGRVLFSFSDREDPYSNEDFDTSVLRRLSYVDGYAEMTENGERMLVTKQTSASGMVYYLVQPAEASMLAFRPYQILFPLFLAFALVIGVYLVIMFSRRNVRPIVQLGQELHDAVETTNQLQEVVDKQKPIICNSYVRQLMLGTVSTRSEMDYVRDYMGLSGDQLCFNVLYAVVYNNGSEEDGSRPHEQDGGAAASRFHEPENGEESLFSIVLTAMNRFFGEPLFRYCPSDRTFAILLVCRDGDENTFIMKIQEQVLRLHEFLLEEYSIWLFAGIGRNTDSLMNVWECYQQAREAINYATKNYIFLPYEIIKKNSNVFYYPPELSTKLIHFITSGNLPQVLELFNLIHQENIEERSLPVQLLKYLLSDIRNTLLKARFAVPGGADKSALNALDAKFDEHLTFKLCEDIAIALCNLFQVEGEDTSLIASIEKYIQDNYKDPSLCLNKISDEFQISESYFSHLFKEKTGVNFSVYLENIRMSEAARLIRETDANLSELYLEVGYNNTTSFRRVFKKIFGVTPSGMREARAGEKRPG